MANKKLVFNPATAELELIAEVPADLFDLGVTDGTNGQVLSTDGAGALTFVDQNGAVDSVNGETGVVVLDKTDIGLTNVDNTSDTQKVASGPIKDALDLKTNTSSLADIALSGDYKDLSLSARFHNATNTITMTADKYFMDHGAALTEAIEILPEGSVKQGQTVYFRVNAVNSSTTLKTTTGFTRIFDKDKIAFFLDGKPVYAFTELLSTWRQIEGSGPSDDTVGPDKITNAAKNEITPIGTVSAFAGASAPDKYLMCDGSTISRTTYSDLYAVLGDVYGNGDGSTTFEIPDLRGEFLRGLDGGRGVDASRTLGSSQDDTTRRPRNTSLTTNTAGDHTHVREAFASVGQGGTNRLVPSGVGIDRSTESAGDHNHSITGGGDAETRPRNIAMNYIIKAEY